MSLEKAGDLRKLVGRELEDAATYSPATSVLVLLRVTRCGRPDQEQQFSSEALDEPGFAVECDWFRLRCSTHELSQELAKPLDVFLCTDDLVVAAAARLSLADLLPRQAWPSSRQDEDFFSSDLRVRRDVASKRPAPAAHGAPSPGYLEVFAAVRRVGPSEEEAAPYKGPLGKGGFSKTGRAARRADRW